VTDEGRANPWLGRRVLNFAHQGGARERPSSTMAAFRGALEAGAHALEMDVHCSADGHLWVCHDPTVDRTTDGSGRIADLAAAELSALDNAYWWVPGEVVDHDAGEDAYALRGRAPADPGYGLAPLEAVLEAFPGVLLNLDIKQSAPDVPPYEHRLAEVLRAYGRTDDVIVASFLDAALDAFAEHAPEVPTSAGPRAVSLLAMALATGDTIPAEVTRHAAVQVPPRFAGTDVVTVDSVARAHEAGLAVHVWTIDDPDEMVRLIRLGVDGIMTDWPSVCARVLDVRGEGWSGAGAG
jgi:glycerophosphoryl diester phosphodiesterase